MMENERELLVEHIKDVPTYQAPPTLEEVSKEVGIPIEELIKLDTNENPYGALPEVRDALGVMRTAHLYPDKEYGQLREALAQLHDIPSSHFVIGTGADEIIDLTMRVILEPGEAMLNCPPAFSMYVVDGRLNRANIVEVPREKDFSYDISAIQKAVEDHNPKLMFIANPNNPDGTVLPVEIFEKLLDLPLLLVIDEAYIDFCDQPSVDSLVIERSDLVVIRTFSKWAGLAGIRLGYGIFPDELAEMVMKAKQPYNVSVAALIAGYVTLANKEKADARIEKIIKNREMLFSGLEEISWLDPIPSQANFVLCEVKGFSAEDIARELRKMGILVRHFDAPRLKDYLRISVGKKKQVEKLLKTLNKVR